MAVFKRIETYLAALLGGCAGTAFHAYILVDHLAYTGNRILAFTGLAMLAAGSGFYFLLRWLGSQLPRISVRSRAALAALGLALALGAFLGGSDAGRDERHVPTFFLPKTSLTIRYIADAPDAPADGSLKWMTTSLGEASLRGANLRGWLLEDGSLRLKDPAENAISWQGKTGSRVTLVFQDLPGGQVEIAVDGQKERYAVTDSTEQVIEVATPVPIYATQNAAKLALILPLWMLFCAGLALAYSRRAQLGPAYRASVAGGKLVTPAPGPKMERWEWIFLLAVFTATVLPRIFNLENLYPYTDEYLHLLAAKSIAGGAPIFSVYGRGLFVVTLPVAAFLKLFGTQVWIARLPGVLFNSLAILPLYLTGRKINRATGIIACCLYATNPWIIAIARTIREYAFYPFYFYWILYWMAQVIENLPGGIVLVGSFRAKIHRAWTLPAAILILPLLYAVFIDPNATFKLVFIVYLVFAAFLVSKLDFSARRNRVILLAGLAVAFTGGWWFLSRQRFVTLHDPASFSASLFFPNPAQQWYFERINTFFLIALLAGGAAAIWQYRHNRFPLFLFAVLAAYQFFFTFFFSRYYRPRYVAIMQYWYILAAAFGLFLLWKLIQLTVHRRLWQTAVVAIILILSINLNQMLLPATYRVGSDGRMPITEEFHYDIGPADAYIRERLLPTDALIGTVYNQYAEFMGSPIFQAIEPFEHSRKTALEAMAAVMKAYSTGWVVVDYKRYNDTPVRPPLETSVIGDSLLEYAGRFGDEYVWHWQPVKN